MSESTSSKKFWGKYRGTVELNIDPEMRGRLLCLVPDVLGPITSTWCEACAPLAGPTGPAMGVYQVPPIGTGVWVEFEQGDPNYPIWVGCRFGSTGDVPGAAKLSNPASPNIVMQTLFQHSIVLSDLPPSPVTGGIILKSTTGATVVVNDSGIYISNGKGATISLIGPMVSINNGALTVL